MNKLERSYISLLIRYLKPQWPRFLLMGFLLVGQIALQVINPQIVRIFLDDALAGTATRTLGGIALLFLGMAIVQQLVSVWATYIIEYVGWTATNRMRTDLTLHCLRLDMSFHHQHTPGELIERIDGDVTALDNFFSAFTLQIVGNILLLVGVLLVLFLLDWRIGSVFVGFSCLTLLIFSLTRGLAVPYWKMARQTSAQLFGFLEERLAGIEDIRSNNAQAYILRTLFQHLRRRMHSERSARVTSEIVTSISRVLYTIGNVAALALGAYLFEGHVVTIGVIYLIYSYSDMVTRPLSLLNRQIEDLQQAGAALRRIGELYQLQPAIQDGPGSNWSQDALAVAFDHVSFGYNEKEVVLKDLSFALEPGKVLGILGRTGCGKTTMTRLLFRLFDPSSGTIYVNGQDLRQARLSDIRERIGLVTQDVQLFHASVRDNLTVFDATISEETIFRALKALGMWNWYQALPNGLESLLSADGGGLSAGEAQLLAFVRVFLKEPELVILDEASSRLDPATERRIEGALEMLMKDRTVIIVAHRLSTVMRADEIMIMEHGRICEYGSRVSLAQDPSSRFTHLMRVGLEEVLL
jgi:ATP-binding cassette, subfamily B, bacterial